MHVHVINSLISTPSTPRFLDRVNIAFALSGQLGKDPTWYEERDGDLVGLLSDLDLTISRLWISEDKEANLVS